MGASSHVNLAVDPETGKLIAVKYVSATKLDKESFMRQVEALSKLNHPCVLQIIRWAFPVGSQSGEIHTEYAEQRSLNDVLKRRRMDHGRRFWTTTRLGIVICDIVLGMRFVHSQQIIHRDLKPSNILIHCNCRAVVGDFGSSRFMFDDATWTGESGTVHYAAPESFQDDVNLTAKVDVWSFGLILYEIVVGCPVFPLFLPPFEVIRSIRNRYRPQIPSIECGEYMKGLIQRCWADDPDSRPSFDEVLAEFQLRQFSILPLAKSDELRGAVDAVLQWESHSRALRS
jgi:serine/threonine protein kinase